MVILRTVFSLIALMLILVTGVLLLAPLLPKTYTISYRTRCGGGYCNYRVIDVTHQIDMPLFQERLFRSTISWSPDGRHMVYTTDDSTLAIRDWHTGEITFLLQGRLLAERHTWSPDGECIAYTFEGGLHRFCSGDIGAQVLPIDNYVTDMDWSPDGERLAYIADDNLYEYALATGETRLIGDNPSEYMPVYTQDGNNVIYSTSPGNYGDLHLLNLQSGVIQLLTAGASPAISRDGRYIAAATGDPSGGGVMWLFMMDLQTRQIRRLTFGDSSVHTPEWVPW